MKDNPFSDLEDVAEEGEEETGVTSGEDGADTGSRTGVEQEETTTDASSNTAEDTQENTPDTVSEPEQTAEEPVSQSVGQAAVSPDATLVKDLATRRIPGTEGRYAYAIRRNGWDHERTGNLKFVMQETTKEMEDEAAEEVMDELFGRTDINRTDLREAAYLVGLRNLDQVVDVLNEWGFAEVEEMRKE